MRNLFFPIALSMFGTLSAQNTPSDLLPSGTEYFEEPNPWGGSTVYVYDITILDEIEGMAFREIRETPYAEVFVYQVNEFIINWVRTNEYAEDPREFLQIFKI